MEEENGKLNPESGRASTKQHQEEEEDRKVVKFLDSADSYLDLCESLSSSLRQGWLELATARQSMGASRINSALFDLKDHSAATSLHFIQDDGTLAQILIFSQPLTFRPVQISWVSTDNRNCSTEEAKFDEDELFEKNLTNAQLRYRGTSEIQEKRPESNGSTLTVDDQIQKERSKSLSMFGTLVSPKLRSAQISFETALDTLVEMANMRSSLLSAYDQVHKDMASTKG